MIHTLKSQGLSVSEIARQLKVDRKTVRKYLRFKADDASAMQRKPRTRKLAAYEPYLLERVHQFPTLTATRLMREIRELGYTGSYTILSDYLRQVRPRGEVAFEVRFETPPGHQAQTDFAAFAARFERQPDSPSRIYLFTMVLGHSRYLWGRFCDNQTLQTVIRMHIRAFEGFGGVPKEILYDRMKTAVIGEDANGEVIYNRSLTSLLEHYGALPRACQPYRAKTKGKVERAYRYIREDFYLARCFDDMAHLNACFRQWLDEVANVRRHGTTRRHVDEAFADEQPQLTPLPKLPYRTPLAIERKVNREGMVCYQGNQYSLPNGTRSHIVEVQVLPMELLIMDSGTLIARHAIREGKGQRVVDPTHRSATARLADQYDTSLQSRVSCRPLSFYETVARRLADEVHS